MAYVVAPVDQYGNPMVQQQVVYEPVIQQQIYVEPMVMQPVMQPMMQPVMQPVMQQNMNMNMQQNMNMNMQQNVNLNMQQKPNPPPQSTTADVKKSEGKKEPKIVEADCPSKCGGMLVKKHGVMTIWFVLLMIVFFPAGLLMFCCFTEFKACTKCTYKSTCCPMLFQR